MKTISTTGKVNEKGLVSLHMDEVNKFMQEHKGKRVIATFRVVGEKTSQAMRGYYFIVVVPAFRKALWNLGNRMTLEETENFLRTLSPIVREEWEEDGEYKVKIKRVSELSNDELAEHIETLKQIASEEFGLYIDDPRVI